jgi:hypothetical protein
VTDSTARRITSRVEVPSAEVRTFLITAEYGGGAAARVARKSADVTRGVVGTAPVRDWFGCVLD